MFLDQLTVSLFDLIKCISTALRLISPEMARHHSQVAFISMQIAEMLGYNEEDVSNITMAAAIHDIGAVSLEENLDVLRFENHSTYNHAELGYLFLKKFKPFEHLAGSVRYHHQHWENGNHKSESELIPMESYIIHLADRAAVQMENHQRILTQKGTITNYIVNNKHTVFVPEHVEAFMALAIKESFWLDCVSESLDQIQESNLRWKTVKLGLEELIDFSRFLSRLVDFRSPLNANHSSGVAASASVLAHLAGFSELECSKMLIAGYLHDIGKLSVPSFILEKAGGLSEEERNLIKGHTYYTYHTLLPLKGFDRINAWAALHHERLDGTGYPFRMKGKDLPLGSQIMAVADIYTALNEDRPYRMAMEREKSLMVMQHMVKDGAINGDLVQLLTKHFDEVDHKRKKAQMESAKEYLMMNPFFKGRQQRKE